MKFAHFVLFVIRNLCQQFCRFYNNRARKRYKPVEYVIARSVATKQSQILREIASPPLRCAQGFGSQ